MTRATAAPPKISIRCGGTLRFAAGAAAAFFASADDCSALSFATALAAAFFDAADC
jgi:hypothetical protein